MNFNQELEFVSQLVNTIMVDDSKGRIEHTEVVKDKKKFKNITNFIDYNLKPLDCNQSLYYHFINDLKNFRNRKSEIFKYSPDNLIQKIFPAKRRKKLIAKMIESSKNSSWMIVPNFLLGMISNITNFVPNLSQENKFYFGKLNDLQVYSNPNLSDNEIIFGNYDMIQLIVNKKLQYYQIKKLETIKSLQII